jgi:uncharacterized membrane protein YkoI
MKSSLYLGVLSAGVMSLAAANTSEVSLSQLPSPVRNTINTETKNGSVARVEQLSQNGSVIYGVYFQQPNGPGKVSYLHPDGTYVQSSDNSNTNRTATASHSWDRLGDRPDKSTARQPLSAATKVNFQQLPAAAQKTLQTEASGASIESIDRGTLNGQTVYEGAFKRNGQTVKLRVAENGAVVRDVQDYRIEASGPLLNAKTVSFKQLPSAVQSTIKAQADQSLIENLQQGQVNGQTVYQASLNRNGQLLELRVNSAGSVISSRQAHSSAVSPQP